MQIQEGMTTCYCPYCRTQIVIDDGNTRITYHNIDEARIREAETRQLLALKELEMKEKQRKTSLIVAAVCLLVVFLIIGQMQILSCLGYE
jgi:hypothetical protein